MEFIESMLGGGMFLFGVFIIGCSYYRQIYNFKNRHRPNASYSSPAPFAGPLLIIAGLRLMSVTLSSWLWLLFVIDPDTVITVLGLPMFVMKLLTRS